MEKTAIDFIEYLSLRGFTKATQKTRLDSINLFIKWIKLAGKNEIKEITIKDLRAYLTLLQDKQYSNYSIDTKIRSIILFFQFLENRQTIFFNPARYLEVPRIGSRLPKDILTEKEVKLILEYPDLNKFTGLRNRVIMEVLYSTALRRRECALLKVSDIDFNDGHLRVNQGKGQKDRIIPIGKIACDFLKQYIQIRPTSKGDILFLSSTGEPLSAQSINLFVKQYGRQLKLNKPITPHSFRRSAVTHMLRRGASPVYLQRILGHSTLSVLKLYLKVSATDIKQMHLKTHPREKSLI